LFLMHLIIVCLQLFAYETPEVKEQATVTILADYYHFLDLWVDTYFDGLKSVDGWEKFYVHLVRILVPLRNEQEKTRLKIKVNNIVMPEVTELFKSCRLLWQATVEMRNGIPDGQHRVAAMIDLLEGWTITLDATATPLKKFVPRERSGSLSVATGLVSCNYPNTRDELDRVLEILHGKAMTRVVFIDRNQKLEENSITYSRMREVSQSQHKPRVFMDT